MSPVAELAQVQMQRLFQGTVFSQVHLIQRCLPQMLARGRGCIVNVVSESGTHGSGGAGPWQQLPTESMPFPLVHPPKVEWDEELDAFVDRVHCNHRGRFARAIWKHGQR
ncbi:MAG: SDR family NAD(P)-dependent oxidoreductase, partial [bacterium]